MVFRALAELLEIVGDELNSGSRRKATGRINRENYKMGIKIVMCCGREFSGANGNIRQKILGRGIVIHLPYKFYRELGWISATEMQNTYNPLTLI